MEPEFIKTVITFRSSDYLLKLRLQLEHELLMLCLLQLQTLNLKCFNLHENNQNSNQVSLQIVNVYEDSFIYEICEILIRKADKERIWQPGGHLESSKLLSVFSAIFLRALKFHSQSVHLTAKRNNRLESKKMVIVLSTSINRHSCLQ